MSRRRYDPFLIVLTVALVPLAAVAAASVVFGKEMHILTRDVNSVADVHPLTGALSNLGILAWWTSVSLWLFSAAVHHAARSRTAAWFAFCSGALTAYVAFDDLFEFHERLGPSLGLPERGFYVLLALAAAAYVLGFRTTITRSYGSVFVVAAVLLACSMVIDTLLQRWCWRLDDWGFFIEDSLKWLGIVAWGTYCALRCRSDVLALLRPPGDA